MWILYIKYIANLHHQNSFIFTFPLPDTSRSSEVQRLDLQQAESRTPFPRHNFEFFFYEYGFTFFGSVIAKWRQGSCGYLAKLVHLEDFSVDVVSYAMLNDQIEQRICHRLDIGMVLLLYVSYNDASTRRILRIATDNHSNDIGTVFLLSRRSAEKFRISKENHLFFFFLYRVLGMWKCTCMYPLVCFEVGTFRVDFVASRKVAMVNSTLFKIGIISTVVGARRDRGLWQGCRGNSGRRADLRGRRGRW